MPSPKQRQQRCRACTAGGLEIFATTGDDQSSLVHGNGDRGLDDDDDDDDDDAVDAGNNDEEEVPAEKEDTLDNAGQENEHATASGTSL